MKIERKVIFSEDKVMWRGTFYMKGNLTEWPFRRHLAVYTVIWGPYGVTPEAMSPGLGCSSSRFKCDISVGVGCVSTV